MTDTAIDVVQLRLRVHAAFRAKDLSIKAAEKECGVGQGTFQDFIAGHTQSLTHENLARIARMTGHSVEELLYGERHSAAAAAPALAAGPRTVPHNLIAPSPLNPRKRGFDPASLESMAKSIEIQGVMQNLVLRPVEPTAAETGPYEIVAGERRWRGMGLLIAAGKAPEDAAMPAAIRQLSDDDALELMLVENIEREDLSPLEEGRAFLELWNRRQRAFGKRKAGEVVKALAAKLNRTERFVQKRIRLARDLDPEVQAALDDGKISLAHAEVLAGAPKDAQRAQAGLISALPIEGQPTARSVGQSIASALPDLALAVFDRKLYDAGVFEFEGKDYAIDIPFFARLQDKAIEQKRAAYRRKLEAEEIAFVDSGTAFKASNYTVVVNHAEDPDARSHLGVYIEVQDNGAWRTCKIVEGLERKAQTTGGQADMFGVRDADVGDDGDDDGGDPRPVHDVAAPRQKLPSYAERNRKYKAQSEAGDRQFAPLRAAYADRADLCLAILIFEDVVWELETYEFETGFRIGARMGVPASRERAERTVAKLGLTWPSKDEDVDAFVPALLDKLLAATEGQLMRFMAEIVSSGLGAARLLELNAIERRVFQAAGLDPDAVSAAATKEAA